MDSNQLISRIRELEELQEVPKAQIEWWIRQAQQTTLQKGDFLFQPGEAADHLHLLVSGRLEIYLENKSGRQGEMELQAPILTGVLPFSRLKNAAGAGRALEEVKLLSLHRDHFPEMVRSHYELTEALVHFMTGR